MLIQAKDVVLGYRVNFIFCEAIEDSVPWTLVVWSSKSSSAFGYSLSPKQEGPQELQRVLVESARDTFQLFKHVILSQLCTARRGYTLIFTSSSSSVVPFYDHCVQDEEFGLESLSLYTDRFWCKHTSGSPTTIYSSFPLGKKCVY